MKRNKSGPIINYTLQHQQIFLREVVSNEYSSFNPEKFTEPHSRNYYSFFLITEGYIHHNIDFNHVKCKQKDIFFLKPGQIYLVDTAINLGGITLIFNPEIISAEEASLPVLRNSYGSNSLKLSGEEYTAVQTLLRKMLVEFLNNARYSRAIIKSQLTGFLLELSRIYERQYSVINNPEKANKIVQHFQLLLQSNWKSAENASSYARLLHITPGHLNQLVKQQTGKNVVTLIHEKKMIEIKRLLIYSSKSIKEIAFETGFEDPAYFNRFFKKWAHSTPLAFRQSNHEKYNRTE
jgi:AraC family transcriptional regulator, transcriptional activator of pobA